MGATEPPGQAVLDLEGRWGRRGAGGARDGATRRTRGVTPGRLPLWEGHRGLRAGGRGDGGGRGRGRGSRARWPRAEGVCGPLGAPGACPARAGLLGGGAVAVPSLPGASGLRLRSLAPGQ